MDLSCLLVVAALCAQGNPHPATYGKTPFPGIVPYEETARAIVCALYNSWLGAKEPPTNFRAELRKGVWRVHHYVENPDYADDSPYFFVDKVSAQTFLINRSGRLDHMPIRNVVGSDISAVNAAFKWIEQHATKPSQKNLGNYNVSINPFEGKFLITFDPVSGNASGPAYNDGKGIYCTVYLDAKTLKVVKVSKM